MWIFFSLGAALCAGLVIVLSKAGVEHLEPTLVFGLEALCIVVVTWSIIFSKNMQTALPHLSPKLWILLLGAGILTAASSLLSFHSLKLGPASRTSSFEKISLVFSVILALIFFKERFTWPLAIGVLLMVAGALFIAFSDGAR